MSGAPASTGYLYSTWLDEDGVEYVKRYPITRRTATRVYFRTGDCTLAGEENMRYARVADLEAHGRAWCAVLDAYVMTEAHLEEYQADQARQRAEQKRLNERFGCGSSESRWTVKECRRQMQRHHPDRGGDAEQFRLWRKRFEELQARGAA